MKIELEVNIPAGYEATGEYRVPKADETSLSSDGRVYVGESYFCSPRIILRKKALTGQAWVDALPEGTVFLYRGVAHQKGACGVFGVGLKVGLLEDCWSDKRCNIIYRPDESK